MKQLDVVVNPPALAQVGSKRVDDTVAIMLDHRPTAISKMGPGRNTHVLPRSFFTDRKAKTSAHESQSVLYCGVRYSLILTGLCMTF